MSRRARAADWTLPLVPALLAGAHVTGLLFFLNPRLSVSWPALVRGSVLHGALFALPSLAFHLALARRRRTSVARLLPWTLTAVIAAGALADWVHASVYSFYLPRGIDVQLIKTALWLTLGGVIAFYTALLHSLHRRRYGARSRLLLALVALGTVYAMFDRRASFRPPAAVAPRPLAVEAETPPRTVVVELPGATLDALLPLAEQGKLPAVAALLDAGAAARLVAFPPVERTALAASWATGKLPSEHGLTGARVFTSGALGRAAVLRLLPLGVGFERWGLVGGGARAIGAEERTALPVWEILARAGRTVALVGYEPPLAGAGVEQLAPARAQLAPLRAEQALAESGWAALAAGLDADRRALAAVRARLAASDPPQVMFVRVGGLEAASLATFGGFMRAEFEGSRAGESRRAADALTTYLAGLDAELAALWEDLSAPRLLVVGSAWGVTGPRAAVRLWREIGASRRTDGSLAGPPDGALLLRGEGVRPGVHLPAARILDVAPTLLYALDLPIARDFDGRVLTETFEPALLQRRALAFVPSYEGLGVGALSPAADAP